MALPKITPALPARAASALTVLALALASLLLLSPGALAARGHSAHAGARHYAPIPARCAKRTRMTARGRRTVRGCPRKRVKNTAAVLKPSLPVVSTALAPAGASTLPSAPEGGATHESHPKSPHRRTGIGPARGNQRRGHRPDRPPLPDRRAVRHHLVLAAALAGLPRHLARLDADQLAGHQLQRRPRPRRNASPTCCRTAASSSPARKSPGAPSPMKTPRSFTNEDPRPRDPHRPAQPRPQAADPAERQQRRSRPRQAHHARRRSPKLRRAPRPSSSTPPAQPRSCPARPALTASHSARDPDILITSVGAGGVATLSRPLRQALPAGNHRDDPAVCPVPGPDARQTARRTPCSRKRWRAGSATWRPSTGTPPASSGPEGYDLEVWNELTFGSQFLNYEHYYAGEALAQAREGTAQGDARAGVKALAEDPQAQQGAEAEEEAGAESANEAETGAEASEEAETEESTEAHATSQALEETEAGSGEAAEEGQSEAATLSASQARPASAAHERGQEGLQADPPERAR